MLTGASVAFRSTLAPQGFYEGAIQTAEAVADTLSGLLNKA